MNIGPMGDRVGLLETAGGTCRAGCAAPPARERTAHFHPARRKTARVGQHSSLRPIFSTARKILGPSWMPAPISLNSGACSNSPHGNPLQASA